jgi:hypothetical protein
VSIARDLLSKEPTNGQVLKRFVGGEDLNDGPTHESAPLAIDFGEMELSEAERWPELLEIVREEVLAARLTSKAKSSSGKVLEKWWRFGHTAKDLYSSIGDLSRVLANSQVSAHREFAFLPTGWVYAHTLNVFALPTHAAFAALQSRLHELWARFFGSTLEDRLRYTPSDCFETFPFPESFDHDPEERSPEILRLRELHDAMDRTVLDAYGWRDLAPRCEFLLDYDDEEEDDAGDTPARGRGRKKPWRHRRPDEVRDEVLARLLELNGRRGEEERVRGHAR